MRAWLLPLVLAALIPAVPGQAIMSGEESKLAPSGDGNYAAGKAAFEREDWPAAIASLELVVGERPWHDNAHALLGYAYRRSGDIDRAFQHYDRALDLNPRHRGALEYLGEMYLQQNRIAEAQATLLRLGEVCRFVVMAFDNQGWKSGCEEYEILRASFETRGIALSPRQAATDPSR